MAIEEAKRNCKEGWDISEYAEKIIKAINKHDGKCPCHNESIDKYCPCTDYIENNMCHCSLYIKR